MIDHIGINVSDIAKSKEFYKKALGALKYELLMELVPEVTKTTAVAGFGENKKPDFWISQDKVIAHSHVCFRARNRGKVDEFYKAAMAAGGIDNGKPGVREKYHPHYYGAFVLDPDGHNIEAVCHDPE